MRYAVFYVNDSGEFEQLTVWMSYEDAIALRDSSTYFSNLKKIVLMRVD